MIKKLELYFKRGCMSTVKAKDLCIEQGGWVIYTDVDTDKQHLHSSHDLVMIKVICTEEP